MVSTRVLNSLERIIYEMEFTMPTEMRSGFMGSYYKQWFKGLMTSGTWIHTDHVNDCCQGLLELQRSYPRLMTQDVSLMEGHFHQIVSIEFHSGGGRSSIDELLQYARGERRNWPLFSLDKARLILIPMQANPHFTLLKFVPHVKKVTVFYSDHSTDTSGKLFHKNVHPISNMVVRVLAALGVTTKDRPWTVTRADDFLSRKKAVSAVYTCWQLQPS